MDDLRDYLLSFDPDGPSTMSLEEAFQIVIEDLRGSAMTDEEITKLHATFANRKSKGDANGA